MSTFELWRLFHRSGSRSSSTRDYTGLLSIIAFAAATTIFLTVLGGLHGFIWRASADHTLGCLLDQNHCAPGTVEAVAREIENNAYACDMQDIAGAYLFFAMFACLLLLVPFATLAGSAARLAASRRDERLAALRLAGATTSQVTRLTAFSSTMQAIIGALIGIIGYFAVMPIIMLLNFQNQHFTFAQLWIGPFALIATVALVALLALVSALLSLRRVAITPLGVSARQTPPLLGKWRLVVFAIGFVGGLVLLENLDVFKEDGAVVSVGIMCIVIIGCYALINVIGSFVISARARARARRPKTAATLIAMRRILDNPKRSWRNVSGIALAVFIAGFTALAGAISTMESTESAPEASSILMRDMSTGGILTLVFAGILAAVSSGIMQSASVYDQADEYHMLMLEGTDEATLKRARFEEVLTPLNIVVLVSAFCSFLLMLPLAAEIVAQPAPILMFFVGIACCYALVAVGAFASNKTAQRINTVAIRADD